MGGHKVGAALPWVGLLWPFLGFHFPLFPFRKGMVTLPLEVGNFSFEFHRDSRLRVCLHVPEGTLYVLSGTRAVETVCVESCAFSAAHGRAMPRSAELQPSVSLENKCGFRTRV